MQMFEVTGGTEQIRVEGDNWLVALGTCFDFFGLDPSSLARLSIQTRADGGVKVRDPTSGRVFSLRPVAADAPSGPVRLDLTALHHHHAETPEQEPPSVEPARPTFDPTGLPEAGAVTPRRPAPPPISMPSSSLAPPEPAPFEAPAGIEEMEETINRPPARPQPTFKLPPPSIEPAGLSPSDLPETAPAPSAPAQPAPQARPKPPTLVPPAPDGVEDTPRSRITAPPPAVEIEDDRPDDLIEQLFFLSMDISMAGTVGEACRQALGILKGLISAESGSVLYSSVNDTDMRFLAAFGPAADRVLDRTIPLDSGVAGFCHRYGVGLMLHDVAHDDRHDPTIDRQVGYQTRSMLTAAIRDPEGNTYGCMQLLNAPHQFRDWHLEATQVIAGSLADFVAVRQ